MDMQSPAKNHYPHFRFRSGEKKLFNPVLKKTFNNRPEERVRLRYVEYLIEEAGWKKNRIGFEIPVQLKQDPNKVRADLILYSSGNLTSFALIECKADSIKPGEQAAVQIARYNSSVKAPYLMVTNGDRDFWFKYSEKKAEISTPPDILKSSRKPDYEDLSYWSDRGFISNESPSETHPFLILFLNTWFVNNGLSARYLNLNPPFLNHSAAHFYAIKSFGNKNKAALTMMDDGNGSTKMIITINNEDKNIGLIEWIAGSDAISIYRPNQTEKTDIIKLPGIDLRNPEIKSIKKIPEQALSLFD